MNFLNNFLQNYKATQISLTAIRWYERRKYKRRYGYYDPIAGARGFLPRVPNDPKPLKTLPVYKPTNSWNERRALFGQNDYIDILGNGDIHPAHIQTHIPAWLRGFQGNEFQMLLRKRIVHADWAKTRPETFNKINKRIKFLYKVFNHRTPSF